MRQEYPARELIVIDDGAEALGELVPPGPSMRYMRVAPLGSREAAWRFALGQARGEMAIRWEEAVWYSPDALLYAVHGRAALEPAMGYDPASGKAWRRKAERAVFCVALTPAPAGARTYPPGLAAAILGNDLEMLGRTPVAPPPLRAARNAGSCRERPLVSAILLARDRKQAALAADYFLRQDYAPCELIAAGSAETLCDLPGSPRLRTVAAPPGATAGALRNLACAEARGGILMQWDEAAWHAPGQIGEVVETMLGRRADLCRLNPLTAYDPASGEAAVCQYPPGHGAALAFQRRLWQRRPYPEAECREDLRFTWNARPRRAVAVQANLQVSIGTIRDGPYRQALPAKEIRSLLGSDWSLYEAQLPPAGKGPAGPPLASCILLVGDRSRSVGLAVEYFLRQDYERKELLVIDDGGESVEETLPHDQRIRYFRLARNTPTGAKRNLACSQAHGEAILHWEDDVWYAPHRIRCQVAALVNEPADLCGLNPAVCYDRRSGRARLYRQPPERGFWAHPASLCYWRSFWEANRFPELDGGAEIGSLMHAAAASGLALPDYHWQVAPLPEEGGGQDLPASAPRETYPLEEVRRLLGDDWPFYEPEIAQLPPTQAAERGETHASVRISGRPLVSCIMPTHNRRRFVPLAIRHFLRQDYDPKELVILDDGTDSVEDLAPRDARIRYLRLESRLSVGAKRNLACEQARGEIILHWDDDDWQAPHRIRSMVETLLGQDLDLCGLNPILFFDLRTGQAWRYRYPPQDRFWVHGSSFCYRRAFWEAHRFADLDVGEDNQFIWDPASARAAALADSTCHVSMIHEANVSPKAPGGSYWEPWRVAEIRRLLGEDWYEYERLMQAGEAGGEAAPGGLRIEQTGVWPAEAGVPAPTGPAPAFTAVAVFGNSLATARGITLRTLRHLAGQDARLLVVDDASDDGAGVWLELLAKRGDIDLVRNARELGREGAVAIACARARSPRVAVLGAGSYPCCDNWLEILWRSADGGPVPRAGREVVRGSCLLIARNHPGGLRFTAFQQDGAAEMAAAAPDRGAREQTELTVVVNVGRAGADRLRNLKACLEALNYQTLERWRYRIVLVEQDEEPRLEKTVAPLVDQYIFACNPGLYSNAWPRNIGAKAAGGQGALCFADIDLLAPPGFLRSGLERMENGEKVLVYETTIDLDTAATERAIRDRLGVPLGPFRVEDYGASTRLGAYGLCTWVEARLFEQIGGYDERFRAWGGEDTELNDRLRGATMVGQLPGAAPHMDHERSSVFYWATRTGGLCGEIMAGRIARTCGPVGDPDRVACGAGFSSAAELRAARAAASIPRHVFTIWISDGPLPENLQRYTATWERLGMEIRRVTIDNLEPDTPYLRRCLAERKYVHATDYLRLWYLFKYGGLYLDNDVEVLRPFDELLSNRLFFGVERPEFVGTAVMGARPGQGLLKLMTDIIEEGGTEQAAVENGPVLLTRLMRERGWQGGDADETLDGITLYSTRRFYPFCWNEEFTPACITPQTFTLHHWCKSWMAPDYPHS